MNASQAQMAASRLMQSRLHLQQALALAPADVGNGTGDGNNGSDGRAHRPGDGSHDSDSASAAQPGASPPSGHLDGPASSAAGGPGPMTRLLGTLRARWAQHPLHGAATLALLTGNAAVRPVAQRHPVALVLVAAACGAALAWAKPWRRVNPRLLAAAAPPGVWPALWPAVLTALVPGLLAALSPTSTRAGRPWWPQLLQALLNVSPAQARRPAGDAEPPASAPTAEQPRAQSSPRPEAEPSRNASPKI